jgi:dihydrodipicolinate synthase/N-acetylneuraminate lyase
LKTVLVEEGVLFHDDVRAPLRELTPDERARVLALHRG